jgi:hypothetical protein
MADGHMPLLCSNVLSSLVTFVHHRNTPIGLVLVAALMRGLLQDVGDPFVVRLLVENILDQATEHINLGAKLRLMEEAVTAQVIENVSSSWPHFLD